jgi:hypothetical protein
MLNKIISDLGSVLDAVKAEIETRTEGNPDYLYDNERHELVNLYYSIEDAKNIYEKQSSNS